VGHGHAGRQTCPPAPKRRSLPPTRVRRSESSWISGVERLTVRAASLLIRWGQPTRTPVIRTKSSGLLLGQEDFFQEGKAARRKTSDEPRNNPGGDAFFRGLRHPWRPGGPDTSAQRKSRHHDAPVWHSAQFTIFHISLMSMGCWNSRPLGEMVSASSPLPWAMMM